MGSGQLREWSARSRLAAGVSTAAARLLLLRLRGLTLAWTLGLALAGAAAQAQPGTLRFKTPPPGATPALGTQVLTPEEREFIARLPEIRVAVPRPPSPPYETLSPDGEIGGIHPDMLNWLASAFGLKLKPVGMPDWRSTLAAAKRREVDLLMTLGATPERSEYLAFTLGATPLPGALFARKATTAAVPLARARFALERAFMANDFVRRQYPQATIVPVDDTGQALAAVAQGRADYYLGSLLEAVDWLGRQPQANVQVQQLMNYGSGYYHFAVRKDWAMLATILNKGIATLRAAPTPELAAAMASISERIVLPQPIVLGPVEARRLIDKPIWRLGAVRGLAMLNEFTRDGQHSGIGAEYAEQLAQQLGIGLHIVPFDNVADMLDGLRQGRIDLVPFLTRTAQREKEFSFSESYVAMPYMIVARSDAPLYWNLDSLRGKRLALAAAHPLRELLARQYADIQIVTTANGSLAMDAVVDGQADAAVEVKLYANLRIHGDNDGQLRAVAEVADLPAQFHFAAGPVASDLIPIVNQALARISPGERERIWRRWVAMDLQPAFPWQRWAPLLGLAAAAALLLVGGTLFWMRRLRREVLQRRSSEERLADIGAALPCVAFRYVLDSGHAVVGSGYYSAGSRELLGERPDPSLTLLDNIGPRLRPDHLLSARQLERTSRADGERLRFIGAYRHPDGRERWLHVEAVCKSLEGGQQAWTGTAVDISAERELQDRIEREAQARNLMLASASHELRAPTHTLSLALQNLSREAALDPQGGTISHSESLRVAQDAARTLGLLLNDVLDAARLDRGALQLRPQVFNPHELLDQVVLEGRAWAHGKGLAFEANLAPDIPPQVQLDPLRLRQILTNLLSNAVKYTGQGCVSLHVATLAAGARSAGPDALPLTSASRVLMFEVQDSGAGISAERLANLFVPYSAGAAAVPEGSTGLGLNISRRLAQLMGGDLELRSQPGAGTRVRLIVPLANQAHDLRPAGLGHAGHAGAVLLCDDDPTCLLLTGQMLRSHGYAVIECADAQQALEAWRSQAVCALVTDLHMDGMNGITLVQRVRDETRGLRVPLLVCSGNPVPAREAGDPPAPFDAWLSKPVQMSLLLSALADLGVPPPALTVAPLQPPQTA